MCELCCEETRDAERRKIELHAKKLDELASAYRQLASGHLKPHSDELLRNKPTASFVIRQLIEDWV